MIKIYLLSACVCMRALCMRALCMRALCMRALFMQKHCCRRFHVLLDDIVLYICAILLYLSHGIYYDYLFCGMIASKSNISYCHIFITLELDILLCWHNFCVETLHTIIAFF